MERATKRKKDEDLRKQQTHTETRVGIQYTKTKRIAFMKYRLVILNQANVLEQLHMDIFIYIYVYIYVF